MNNLIWSLLCLACVIPANRYPSSRPELWAFTGPWDPRSDSSLRANAPHLGAAVTGWIGLDSVTAQPIIPTLYPDTMHLVGATKRMAIVTSWHGDRFHPSSVRTLARDGARLGRAAGSIASHAAAMKYSGLVLDLEALDRSDLPALLRVVKA